MTIWKYMNKENKYKHTLDETPKSLSVDIRCLQRRKAQPYGGVFTILFFSILLSTLYFVPTAEAVIVNSSSIFLNNGSTLTSGLVGHWTFDGKDVISGKVKDRSGQGNDGSPSGIATSTFYTTGKTGQAFNFDGVNDYVSIPNQDRNTLSASMWIRRMGQFGTINNSRLLMGQSSGWAWYIQSDNQEFGKAGVSAAADSSTKITDTKWHHIAVTYDGSTTRYYLDGNADGSPAYSTTFNNGGAVYGIGSDPTFGGFFNGYIDDVRIYNRVLTGSEITQLYKMASPTMQASSKTIANGSSLGIGRGLVAHWTFDGKDVSGTTVTDKSGNAYTGTLTNAQAVLGRVGQGRVFPESTSMMVLSSPVSLSSGTWSIASWFKYPFPTAACNTLTRGQNYDHQVIVDCYGTLLGTYDNHGTGFNSSGFNTNTLSTGWHHIVAVGTGSVTMFYIDGAYVGSANYKSTTDVYSVGNYWGGDQEFGTIDDTRIYNRALTAGEIKQLYLMSAPTMQSSSQTLANGTTLGNSSGLVAHWTFDGKDTRSGEMKDVSGNGKNGNPVAIATSTFYTTGKLGQALSFDGVNDSIAIPSVVTYPFTVSLWATQNTDWNPAGSGTMDELFNMSISGQRVSLGITDYWVANGEITIMYGGTSHWGATKPSQTGPSTWNHIVFVVPASNDSSHKVYVNGVSQTMTDNGGGHGGTAGWNIGSNSGSGEYWDGKIDDVRVYNRLLSASEVKQLYSIGK